MRRRQARQRSEGNGRERIPESDPNAPVVRVVDVGFQAEDWHHIAFTWSNFDTGREDAEAALYIDGEWKGNIGPRNITMDWDIEQTGVYVAVNYVGLLDELMIFDRALTAEEVNRLRP